MFTIRRSHIEEDESVRELLKRAYYVEEPLVRSYGLEPARNLSREVLLQGHSFVAVSEDGELVGVTLNDQPPQDYPVIYSDRDDDVKFQQLFNYIEKKSGVLKCAPNALEIRMLAVDKRWHRRGVATALLEAVVKEAERAEYPFLKLYCTSNYSSRLMEKLNWRKLYSQPYDEYMRDHWPEMVLPPDPHKSCNLYIYSVKVGHHQHLPICSSPLENRQV